MTRQVGWRALPAAATVILWATLLASPAPAETVSFGGQFPVGNGPVSVAVGDFNGDGTPDVAVANEGSNTVSVLLGNGDGTFQPALNFDTGGSGAVSVVVGDFNRDGAPDLAVANQGSNAVAVLLGNGDGSFRPAMNFGAGGQPNSLPFPEVSMAMAVGDFNGDGTLDLAVANRGSNTVAVLLGNGDGTLQAPVTFAVGSAPTSVAVGDFNGDGRPDLAVTNLGSKTVSVLLGNGDGTFQPALTVSTGHAPVSVAVGDFNGDGRPDLAVGNIAVTIYVPSTVSVLLGNGDGTFQAARTSGVGPGTEPLSMAVGDFNGDGKLDLAVVTHNTQTHIDALTVLLGSGDGAFSSGMHFATGPVPASVAVADFNADGMPDLAVTNGGFNTVSVLLGDGDGTFQPRTVTTGGEPVSVAVGDFNGDGRPDLAVANERSSDVSVLLGNGDGTFQPARAFGVGILTGPSSMAVGDFNGDGTLDLAVTSSSGISVLLGQGDAGRASDRQIEIGRAHV